MYVVIVFSNLYLSFFFLQNFSTTDIENSSDKNDGNSKYNVFDVVANPVDEDEYMQTNTNADKLMCNSMQMIREKLHIDDGM